MADDIKVVADFTDLQLLRRELVGVSKDAQKSAAVFEREFNKVERQLKVSATASQKWYSETLKLSKATKDASQSASVFERELAKQEARVESLAMKYKPLYASSKQYERALEEINEAHRLNVLNTQQHEAAVEKLNQEYTAFINGKAGWENQFVTGSSRAGKSLNRFGMYAQQVGYQVGDFFVQVQSGTNVFVAFGQQATQLAGLLPGVAGAVVGIGIAISTTLLAMWDRSRQAASGIKEFEDALKNARDASKDLQAENERLARGFEDLSQAAFAQAVEQAYAKVLEAEQNLAALRENEGGHRKRNRVLALQQAQADLDVANAELDSLRERLKLNQQLRDQQEQNVVFTDALAESTEKARSKAQAYVESVSKLEEELGVAAVDALALADVDLSKGVSAAAKEAAKLAASLGVSLTAAINIMNLQSSKKYSGRGGDPRKVGSGDYTNQLGYKTVDQLIKEMTGKGGGSEDPLKGQLEQLQKFLSTEQELLLMEYETRQETLEQSLEKEYITRQQYNEMFSELERKKAQDIAAIESTANAQRLGDMSSFFGAAASVAAAGGDRMTKVVAAFQGAQAVISAYSAYAQVLADPSFIGRPWARFAAGAKVLAAGLGAVRAIKGAGSSGSASGAAAAVPATASVEPQRVIVEGLDRNSLYTGEQLSNIFEALYKENKDRGFVFEVAR